MSVCVTMGQGVAMHAVYVWDFFSLFNACARSNGRGGTRSAQRVQTAASPCSIMHEALTGLFIRVKLK